MNEEEQSTEQTLRSAKRNRPARPGWPKSQSKSKGTNPETALNLADLGHEENLCAANWDEFHARLSEICNETCARLNRHYLDRIYVGSYFCDRFFLSLNKTFYENLFRFCRIYKTKATLVAPIFGQSTLKAGKSRIGKILAIRDNQGFLFDEAVVNDQAMALFIRERVIDATPQKEVTEDPETQLEEPVDPCNLRTENQPSIIIGRLMAKSSRDPRHDVMEQSPQPYALDEQQALALMEKFGYSMAECDPTAPVVDASPLNGAIPLSIHAPHCLMTTGHICQLASLNLPKDMKFRADAPCRQECLRGVQVYEHHNYDSGEARWFTRLGRSIFFENPGFKLQGTPPSRIVWTPADFLCSSAQSEEDLTESPSRWNFGEPTQEVDNSMYDAGNLQGGWEASTTWPQWNPPTWNQYPEDENASWPTGEEGAQWE